mgnify:CR=1 FL=1
MVPNETLIFSNIAITLLISFMGCSCKYLYFYVTHITVIKLLHNETPVNYFCEQHHKTLVHQLFCTTLSTLNLTTWLGKMGPYLPPIGLPALFCCWPFSSKHDGIIDFSEKFCQNSAHAAAALNINNAVRLIFLTRKSRPNLQYWCANAIVPM